MLDVIMPGLPPPPKEPVSSMPKDYVEVTDHAMLERVMYDLNFICMKTTTGRLLF